MATTRKRKRGTGSLSLTSAGHWRGKLQLRNANGELEVLTRQFGTPEEVEKWLDETISAHQGGPKKGLNTSERTELTFRDFAAIWMGYKFQSIIGPDDPSIRNLNDYESLIRMWMIPKLGTIRLKSLHWDNISDWLKWIQTTESPKTGKKLSASTQRRVWIVFKQLMKYATAEEYVARNPIGVQKGIKLPSVHVQDRPMKKDHFHLFQDLLQAHGCDHENKYCELRWELALSLARRQGEILGLRWEDVHLEHRNPHIQLNRHLVRLRWNHGCTQDSSGTPSCGRTHGGRCPQRKDGGLIMAIGTKQGSDVRPRIPLTPEMVELFKKHRVLQKQELKAIKLADKMEPYLKERGMDNLVFTRFHNGNAWSGSDDWSDFKRLLEEAGIDKDYRVHDLRHTAITHLIENTGNISTAQQIANHATILTTQAYISSDLPSLVRDLATTSKALRDARVLQK